MIDTVGPSRSPGVASLVGQDELVLGIIIYVNVSTWYIYVHNVVHNCARSRLCTLGILHIHVLKYFVKK